MQIVLTLGGVGTVKGRIKHAQQAIRELISEINPHLVASGFLNDAPFRLISGVVRYSENASDSARIDPIDMKHSELPFTIQISLPDLKMAPKELVREQIERRVCEALRQIAEMYNLPASGIDSFSSK